MSGLEFLGLLAGFVITIVIFSYLLKDTALYRWGLALLVGGGIGYTMGLTWQLVLRDWIFTMVMSPEFDTETILTYVVPIALGALLLFKGFNPTKSLGKISVLGNVSLALMLGVGAALAITGGLLGTLIPQVMATSTLLNFDRGVGGLIQGIVMIVGTITSLHVFSVRIPKIDEDEEIIEDDKPRPVRSLMDQIGRVFIAVALGVAFGGAVSSALTVLVMRLSRIIETITGLQGG